MKPGTKFSDLLILENKDKTTLLTAEKILAVYKGTIAKKETTQFLRNSKNAMAMSSINQFKGHRGSAVNGVHVTTSSAETTMATEWNKFKVSAFGAAIHSATKRRVTTINHLINVFNNRKTRMSCI